MHNKNSITILTALIVILAIAATGTGILSTEGNGEYQFKSIRGKTVTIYGKGLYKHMSAEVAPQGIAQDFITLLVAIPLLIFSLVLARKGSLRGLYLLAGTLAYFLVTYLFYTVMGMYNAFYLVYVTLLGSSFYAFIITLQLFDKKVLTRQSMRNVPVKTAGSFLVFISIVIAILWLSIVVPPLLDGTIIPAQVEHYTTLVVQGLDLGLLLPAAFLSGVLIIKRKPMGFLLAPVYLGFLSILMTALTAKVIAMFAAGYNVIPAIFMIPTFNVLSVWCMVAVLKHIDTPLITRKIHYENAGAA